ncbi:lipase chaperone [Massilia sp. Root418]|uniref:lipase secretion chaperone n=1 Tax=Massilia sp. Root418 TaxID=1736532 RepID=UPI0007003587|nr:lipase secretion chaperone [Massilia sp. Root418]KQX01212.1 lipase chaperone [Massilia sp. Root418]
MNAKLPRLGTAAAAIAVALGALHLALPPRENAEPAPPRRPDYFAFVRSMEGTTPDGAVKADSAERLQVDEELGYLFDYYLASLGEKDLPAVRSEIERELERRLRPAPAAEAKRLLASYLAYKRALADVESRLPKSADMAGGARARLAAMQQLRPQYFTPAQSAGLFGSADAQAADTIARLELAADRSLSAAEREARMAALDGRLPPAMREQRAAPTRVLRLEESVQQLRAQGVGDNEVYRLRAAALSPEAASRLAEVDREEADWKRRIAQYQAASRKPGAEPASQALRDAYFTPEEQRRLGAYE